MIRFIGKFKIPTILGLGLIVMGIASGVFLVIRDQVFFTKASPSLDPQNVTVTNIEDTTVSISWQTSQPTASLVKFGQKTAQEQTVLDDQDKNTPTPRSIHYATIKDLTPQSNYLFKIISGNLHSNTLTFTTAPPTSLQNGFGPIIGTVLDGNNPLEEGIVYLSISDATTQSAIVKSSGNFLIPISLIRKGDLSDTFQPKEEQIAKLTIIASAGQASALFKIKVEGVELPPISLGQSIDLTMVEEDKFDLNRDGRINSIDYSEVLKNFGKNPRNKQADFNADGVVDNIDLDQIAEKLEIN